MNLLDMSIKFVEGINLFLRQESHDLNGLEIERLVQRIEEIQLLVKDSEDRFKRILESIEVEESIRPDTIVAITKNKKPLCILGKEIVKPRIESIDAENIDCCHTPSFGEFKAFSSTVYVKTLDQLLDMDKTITQAAIEMFDHSYRSYEGFTCFISVGDAKGNVYIIDAIKFRAAISRLELLKCHVPKIIHCRACVERLLRDFRQVGCFRSYEISPKMVFIDWRIRPVPGFLLEVLFKGVHEIREMAASGVEMKVYCSKEIDETKDMASRYGISEDEEILENLLKLRRFLARSNDESVHYVMTDDQVVRLLKAKPTTQEKMVEVLKRLSPLARQHIMDFILLFSGSKKSFLLKDLMEPNQE
ncbi:hypothetical protein EROM_111020 [Encephalitozoon romaleae SJ-2008]|uniref:HRDC domain-containing protein n=1 Tax=Encephalitozoon romaleae (strain SJ-2008) TaxID=1178016 RepID=I7AQC9_ENCRO|nr:hypothetical protein EROM_111020 [Encephalitozoon romaleae SJ-2008]AFN84084.1 hypothetical protein EROM_111020 [Encephalitozoon romaleae SJ-2008]